LVWLSADIAAKHLSSRAFTSAARRETAAAVSAAAEAAEGSAAEDSYEDAETAAAIIAERLQEGYAELAECALLLVQTATTASAATGAASPAKLAPADAKVAGRVERGGRRVLTALDDLLAPGAYLRALSPLLDHADARVRRKALRLVAHRLRAAAAAAAAAGSNRRRRRGERSRDARSRERIKNRAWRRDDSGVDSAEAESAAAADAEETADEFADEIDAGTALVRKLAELARGSRTGGGATRQAALAAIDAAAARFAGAAEASASLLAAFPAAVDALDAPSRGVVAAAASCFASIVESLGARSLPALPAAVPALFRVANAAAASLADAKAAAAAAAKDAAAARAAAAKEGDEAEGDEAMNAEADRTALARDDEGRVLVASLRAVDALSLKLGGFLSPYLPDLLRLLLSPALVPAAGVADSEEEDARDIAATERTSATEASAAAAALRARLPETAPPRLLLRPLSDAYDAAIVAGGARGASSARAALRLMASSAKFAPPPPAHRDALVASLLKALDVRRESPTGFPPSALDATEAAAVEAYVGFALTLTETSFVPVFSRTVEWAKARAAEASAARARLAALFRLSAALSDALRAVFTPLATPLLDLAAAALDPASDPPAAGGPAKKKKRASSGGSVKASDADAIRAALETWRMRTQALACLRRLFANEAGDFLDAGRFEQLHPLVTRQLVATPPNVAADSARELAPLPEAEEGAHLHPGGLAAEATACVSAMVAAAPDDALWRPAHRGVLQATRDASPRARLVALAALEGVVSKLEEEYLALLPEAIPFLSELFEDPDEAVEGAARTLTARLTELSGEDLKSLMRDGGER